MRRRAGSRSSTGPRRWAERSLALVVLLVASLASGGALPWIAGQLGGPAPHVCRCSAHYECVCARCRPDHPELRFSEESVKGKCGDDDAVFGSKAFKAVVARSVGLPVAGALAALPALDSPALVSLPSLEPPVPPPRA